MTLEDKILDDALPELCEDLWNSIMDCQKCDICAYKSTPLIISEYSSGGVLILTGYPEKDPNFPYNIIIGGLDMPVYSMRLVACEPRNVLGNGKTLRRVPFPEEIHNCGGYVKRALMIFRPRYLILVGKTAVTGLFPDIKDSIAKLAGKVLEYHGIPAIPVAREAPELALTIIRSFTAGNGK